MSRVAAAMMPMISAASRTSRKTMRAVPNMVCYSRDWPEQGRARQWLLRDDHALRRLLVELADELVFARLERPDDEGRRRLARDHLLAVELLALEFLRRRILVLDDELHLLARRHLDLVRREHVVLDDQLEFG